MNVTTHLHLDRIKIDLQLIKLLPRDVATRCHAVPIATDGRQITVAMASPDDPAASDAVAAAIGAPVCLVQADLQEIDERLAEVWLDPLPPRMRYLAWLPTADPGLLAFVQAFAGLFDAQVDLLDLPRSGLSVFRAFRDHSNQSPPDLNIVQGSAASRLQQPRLETARLRLVYRLNTPVMFLNRPRWPLKKVLLTLWNGGQAEKTAVDWAVLIAQCSHAAVTILPVLPPVPGMFDAHIRHRLPALLASDDPLGCRVRSVSRRLADLKIHGNIRLREGSVLEQVYQEIRDLDPDMVVIGAGERQRIWRWMTGEMVKPLLRWGEGVLFVATPNKEVLI